MKAYLLRPWRKDDLEDLVYHADNLKIARFLRDNFPHPYTREDGIKFLDRMASVEGPTQVFAIEVEGRAVGGIGVHLMEDIYRKNAEIGYWLGEEHWGKGIMTQALGELVSYAFANFDVTRLFAIPFHDNPGSQKVLEKAGFILEARLEKTIYKLGEYKDELIYAIRKS